MVTPKRAWDFQARERASLRPLGAQTRCLIALRCLAGCPHHNLRLAFSSSTATVYRTLSAFVVAVLRTGLGGVAVCFPSGDSASVTRQVDKFQIRHEDNPAQHCLDGCVGSLDGLAIRIERPKVSDRAQPVDLFQP
eukprot:Plantae.Rhodophyta-Rhodochaete_pulchella.ctg23930.p1 GENE.Plantae.Rhodophyta-Rhodochaete_pulchella.ctg23930~~Plantae.Rhodophyta-Rhodochaete_pulchella.ctg23930.p1  ORF type:complete len:136 (-),score=0.10 Plantae.Rhodophyta-Rhodochaete_pulchella.ctg23930:413-820(-)